MLLIVKIFYLGYSLLLLFDNTTSYLVYGKNTFQVKDMNKRL